MKNRLLKITIMLILATAFLATTVYAANFSVSMVPNTITAAENAEFTITVKVSTVAVTQDGINAIGGFLSYNKDMFQVVNVEGLNNWSASYFPDNDKVVLTKASFVKTEENVVKIVLKVKPGAGKQASSISLKNIEASNDVQDFAASDVSAQVSVNGTAGSNTNSGTVNSSSNNTNNTNNVNNSGNNGSNNSNSSNSNNIPKAGIDDTVGIFIILTIIIAGIFYIKYEWLRKIE